MRAPRGEMRETAEDNGSSKPAEGPSELRSSAVYSESIPPSSSKLQVFEPRFNYPATNNAIGYIGQSQPGKPNTHKYSPNTRAQSDVHGGRHCWTPTTIVTLAKAALAVSPGFLAPAAGPSMPDGCNHAYPAIRPHTNRSGSAQKRHGFGYLPSPPVGQYASRPSTSCEANV